MSDYTRLWSPLPVLRERVRVRASRRGISLLEVLIAIFVTAIGLLGVAALIPIGTFQVGEANKSIRAWDIAQAAYREMQVRDMLNPNRWVDGTGNAEPTPGAAFVIDPYFFARNGYVPSPAGTGDPRFWFPFAATEDANLAGSFPFPYQMRRLSLVNRDYAHLPRAVILDLLAAGQLGGMDRLLAERIFSGQDDLTFTAPADVQQRPFPLNMVEPYTDSDSSGQYEFGEPFIDLNGNGVWDNQSHVQPTAGDYSWMITVAPNTPWLTGVRSYSVSIVVFYKRKVIVEPTSVSPSAALSDRLDQAETPGERTVFADLLDGTTDGGRSIFLYYRPTTNPEAKYLDVRAGNWLLLGATLDSTKNLSGASPLLQWYRIVSVGELLDDPTRFPQLANLNQLPVGTHGRLVTLAGPDIDSRLPVNNLFQDLGTASLTTSTPTMYAILFEGVVNVFERTMELR